VPPRKESPSGDKNLLYAVGLLVLAAFVSAACSAFICDFVLRSFQDSQSMVLLITDAGTKSDDKNLERNLTSATLALKSCRDLGWALSIGCLGVGVAVFLRLRRQNAS
jgi:hypothetical protein